MNRRIIKFFIIIKEKSERIKNKNFIRINKKPLYSYLLDELVNEQVYIDTDSIKLQRLLSKEKKYNKFSVYLRDQKFIDLEKSKKFKVSPVLLMIENFIKNYCQKNDIIICSHVTSPFIKKKTIYNALDYLEKGYDSISSVTYHHEFGLLKKNNKFKPINFNPNIVNKTQDLDPIVLLNGSFFIFKAKTFLKNKSRYSKKHYYYAIDYPESIDINYSSDLKEARVFAKNKNNEYKNS